MHDDLVDAVQWAIERGIADPDKICIFGEGYGGYAALVGLTMTPEIFACGIAAGAVVNLVTLLEMEAERSPADIEFYAARLGDHRTEEGREFLLRRSPLTHVDRVRSPLLLVQDANDPTLSEAESEEFVAAMQAAGIPVTYLLYSETGGPLAGTLSFRAVLEAFLHRHLGGLLEPIGDDLAGSGVTAVAGAEQIPGLAEALAELSAD